MDLITLAAANAYTDKKVGGGGDELFVVNLSGSLLDEYLTADKTLDETLQAYKDGKNVRFVYKQIGFDSIISLYVFSEVSISGEYIYACTSHHLPEVTTYKRSLTYDRSGVKITSERDIPYFRLTDAGIYVTIDGVVNTFEFDVNTPFIVDLKNAIQTRNFNIVLPFRMTADDDYTVFTARGNVNGMHLIGGTASNVNAYQFAFDALVNNDLVKVFVSLWDANASTCRIETQLIYVINNE